MKYRRMDCEMGQCTTDIDVVIGDWRYFVYSVKWNILTLPVDDNVQCIPISVHGNRTGTYMYIVQGDPNKVYSYLLGHISQMVEHSEVENSVRHLEIRKKCKVCYKFASMKNFSRNCYKNSFSDVFTT